MLIVAIPKSASTSIMSTLGLIHGLDVEQAELRHLERPAGISCLHRHHPDIVELDATAVERFTEPAKIYKQHLPPTENNVELLRGHRVIVLLRDPDEVVDAYHRAFKSFAMESAGADRSISLDEWRSHADQVGLVADLRLFHDGWAAVDGENFLVITFDKLVAEPRRVLNAVERHLGLPETAEDVELRKDRYTRSRLHKAKRLAGKVARSLGLYRGLVKTLRRLNLYEGYEYRDTKAGNDDSINR